MNTLPENGSPVSAILAVPTGTVSVIGGKARSGGSDDEPELPVVVLDVRISSELEVVLPEAERVLQQVIVEGLGRRPRAHRDVDVVDAEDLNRHVWSRYNGDRLADSAPRQNAP